MKSVKEKLSGIFAPVVTPFRGDDLLLDSLRDNLQKLNETALAGYLALGSNGEFSSLTTDEQWQVVEVFCREKGSKVVMAGTACESTRETIEKSKKAADKGCDFVSVLTPHYFAKRMTDDILIDYYEAIADACPVPTLIYNAPGFAGGVNISPKAVARLAKHENIVGMKDSSATGPGRYLIAVDPSSEFHVLAGSANFFFPSMLLGASGGVLSLANVFPAACCDLYDLVVKGDLENGLKLHAHLTRLNSAVSGTNGVAGVKGAMDVVGFHGGEPRRPLVPVNEADKELIREKIRAEGFTIA